MPLYFLPFFEVRVGLDHIERGKFSLEFRGCSKLHTEYIDQLRELGRRKALGIDAKADYQSPCDLMRE